MKNEKSSLLLDTIVSIFKISLYILIAQYTGYLLALLVMFFLCVTYRKILMEKILKLRMLKAFDKVFVGDNPSEFMNLVGTLHLKNFDIEYIKKTIKVAFNKNKKLGSRLIYRYSNYYWEETEFTEERFNKIVRTVPGRKDFDEAMEYAIEEVNHKLELSQNGIQIDILPFTEGKDGVLVFKCDHSFSDGLGMVTLLFTLCNNITPEHFPKSLKNKSAQGTLVFLYSVFQCLIFGWGILYQLMTRKAKSKIFNKKASGHSHIAKPLKLSLTKVKEVTKKLNITINEFALTLVSATLKKFDPQTEDYSIVIPIGNTRATSDISKAPIKNLMGGISFSMSLIEDIEKDKDKVLNEMKTLLRNKIVSDITFHLTSFFNEILPFKIMKSMGMDLSTKVDMTISNMPGPTKPLFYGDMELETMIPINTVGPNKAFAVLFSYKDTLWFTPEFDRNQGQDPVKFRDTLNEIFENLYASLKNKEVKSVE